MSQLSGWQVKGPSDVGLVVVAATGGAFPLPASLPVVAVGAEGGEWVRGYV